MRKLISLVATALVLGNLSLSAAEVKKGWNLLGTSKQLFVPGGQEVVTEIWTFKNSAWAKNPDTIPALAGYWAKASRDGEINVVEEEGSISLIGTGWNLLDGSANIPMDKISAIWTFNREKNPNPVTGKGYWFSITGAGLLNPAATDSATETNTTDTTTTNDSNTSTTGELGTANNPFTSDPGPTQLNLANGGSTYIKTGTSITPMLTTGLANGNTCQAKLDDWNLTTYVQESALLIPFANSESTVILTCGNTFSHTLFNVQ